MATGSNPSNGPMTGICFFMYCLLEGLQRISGILFFASIELFGMCRMSASVPFVVNRATVSFTGVLLEFFGELPQKHRRWILLGSFLSATGVGLCFFTTEVLWLAVSWGLVFGVGIGLALPFLSAELTKERNQTVISSLLPASSSFGCIVLPFLISVFISNYGLNGCFLILAGLILNTIPFICIAKYKIRFHLPMPKWRLRKRSKRYRVSHKEAGDNSVSSYKPTGIKEFTNESFLQNLEPDTLQKVSDADNGFISKYGFADIFQPIIDAKIKMATTGIIDKEAVKIQLEQENEKCSKHEEHFDEKISELVTDIQKYESSRMIFEKSFSHKDVLSSDMAGSVDVGSIANSDEHVCMKGSRSAADFPETKSWKEVEEKENAVNVSQREQPPIISSTNTTIHLQKGISPMVNQGGNTYPLEIKVHVVECTITMNTESLGRAFNNEVSPIRRKGYRRHSNSLISGCYDNIDFTQLLLNSKASSLQKDQFNHASRMFLISEEDETDHGKSNSIGPSPDVEAGSGGEFTPKARRIMQKFHKLLKPSCLTLICASVTYELTLFVLLTIFADFAKDTDDATMSSNFVLVAFGLGGIVGQLSFTYWGNRLLADGSHAAAAIIFMLNGLAVAGILWSANICWLSGFYATLGFVEGGILLILPRLVADFIEGCNAKLLSSAAKCLSGIAILCMPFAIGLSRDRVGDYDGLLQVTSCLSVVCALLCYFLPRFANARRGVRDSVAK